MSRFLVQAPRQFFGPRVVRATFVMALLGWGIGFYGPPIFLHAAVQRTGWSLALVSTAVTAHYLFGALVITLLPRLHRRHGVGNTAVAGAFCATLGMLGWSLAAAPWQLFAGALLSGAGWVTMGAAAVNAAIAPWYVRSRPMALAKAYNGASVGGVVFAPLWAGLIGRWGFTAAVWVVGMTTIATMAVLARRVYAWTPERLGQHPDGDASAAPSVANDSPAPPVAGGWRLWGDRRFATLALAMATGLFAQVGLFTHLFSLLVPALGTQAAGLAMGIATACAIGGRFVAAGALRVQANRRGVAAAAYAVQLGGALLLLGIDDRQTALILLAVGMFGSGIGNAVSLPPLIAQAEFARNDVSRIVALIVALAQAAYSFAPAAFGLVLSASAGQGGRIGAGTAPFFLLAAACQGIAIACLLASGRRG